MIQRILHYVCGGISALAFWGALPMAGEGNAPAVCLLCENERGLRTRNVDIRLVECAYVCS